MTLTDAIRVLESRTTVPADSVERTAVLAAFSLLYMYAQREVSAC